MTEQEIRKLLAVLMGYDNRKPGTANILVWMEQARRKGWTYAEAEEAVHEYHETAEKRPFMMPGHVTDLIKAGRLRRKGQAKRAIADAKMRAIEPPPDAIPEPERVEELVGQISQRLGWIRTNPGRQALEMSILCPHCDAGPNRPCARKVHLGRMKGQFVPIAGFHESRSQLAARVRAEGSESDSPSAAGSVGERATGGAA